MKTARADLALAMPARTSMPCSSTGTGCGHHAGGDERTDRQGIAGILDPDFLACELQHADDEIDGVLGPGRDDDLVRVAAHAARDPR